MFQLADDLEVLEYIAALASAGAVEHQRTDSPAATRWPTRGYGTGRVGRRGSGCGGRATPTRGDKSMNYYPLLIALGLLFLAASFLVTHRTGRIVLVVLSCVAFLVAAILTVVGTAGVPGG